MAQAQPVALAVAVARRDGGYTRLSFAELERRCDRIAHGLVLACGNMGGAWIASRLALEKGAAWIRIVVVIAAVGAVTKLILFPTVR